jgi:hypothetical protein
MVPYNFLKDILLTLLQFLILVMEEIKKLYQKLEHAPKEEREKIWKIIIKKNKVLFNKRSKELSKILKKY